MSNIGALIIKHNLTEIDLIREHGHVFVSMEKIGLTMKGQCCLVCGILRRRDGSNKPCKGAVTVEFRHDPSQ